VPNKNNILAAAQSANSNMSGLPKMVGAPVQFLTAVNKNPATIAMPYQYSISCACHWLAEM